MVVLSTVDTYCQVALQPHPMGFYQQASEHSWKERVLKITLSSKNAERSEGSLGCEVSYWRSCGLWGHLVGPCREEGGARRDRCRRVLAAGGKPWRTGRGVGWTCTDGQGRRREVRCPGPWCPGATASPSAAEI